MRVCFPACPMVDAAPWPALGAGWRFAGCSSPGSQPTARFTQGAAKVPLPGSPYPARMEPPSKEEGQLDGTSEWRGRRSWGGKAALAVGGMLIGGILVGTLTASAANNGGTAIQKGGHWAPGGDGGRAGPA